MAGNYRLQLPASMRAIFKTDFSIQLAALTWSQPPYNSLLISGNTHYFTFLCVCSKVTIGCCIASSKCVVSVSNKLQQVFSPRSSLFSLCLSSIVLWNCMKTRRGWLQIDFTVITVLVWLIAKLLWFRSKA